MFDLLIEGGELIDGTGAPRRRGDVGIDGERIAALGDLRGQPARRRLDARGCIVAPGFIDSHAHDDALLLQPDSAQPKLLQGVTTVVTGNCGLSLAPLTADTVPPPLDLLGSDAFRFARFSDYLNALDAARPATNAACLVGHTTLRVGALPMLERAATLRECERMRAALDQALQAGALGLSTGVYYPPARAATADELIAVAEPLRGGGLLAVHLRDEGPRIEAALEEAFAVARALSLSLVLSHHKLVGLEQHGRSRQTLALIEAQASRGLQVCLDCYPYAASSTMLLPERVDSASDVQITWSQARPDAAGQRLSVLAAQAGVSAAEMARRLQPAGAIYFALADEDVDRIVCHPLAMIGSDGLPHDRVPHPRLWGTFPRVLGLYARERGLLSLEAAVHKMTGLPAQRFGLHGRGRLAPRAHADLCVFDPAAVRDRAHWQRPCETPQGIAWVVVNGAVAVERTTVCDPRRGKVLRCCPRAKIIR